MPDPRPKPIDEVPASKATAQPTRRIRVLIADDLPIIRAGLRLLLGGNPSLQIVGDTAVGPSAAAFICDLHPDILLLGSSSSSAWLDLLKAVVSAAGPVRTILLVKSIAAPEIIDGLRCGACGVVPQDSAPDLLLESVTAVAAGEYWIGCDRAAGDPADTIRRLQHAAHASQRFGLTRREIDIARRVVQGDTNREIAAGLAISENTVKRHVLNVFDKVGVSNRVELALFVAYHRFLDDI
jgi:DNA-binding NarL/FixJ family response regulator